MTNTYRRTSSKTCKFWDCDKLIRGHFEYCYDHYQASQKGEINDCPECGRAKDAKYETCLDCRPSRVGTSSQQRPSRYQQEHSPAWQAGDDKATAFFVYILKLKDLTFYAGQTRELRERLMGHRDGTTKSTSGQDPKLVWFAIVPSREEATSLEVQLKKLCDRNPREIRRWILTFQDLVKELDFN